MMAGILPMLSKVGRQINRKCCHILLRATVVFLLVAASISSYFAASRNANQYSSYNDFDVRKVSSSYKGSYFWSRKSRLDNHLTSPLLNGSGNIGISLK